MTPSDVVPSLKHGIAVILMAGALACSHARPAATGAGTNPDDAARKREPASRPSQPAAAPAPAPAVEAGSIYFGLDDAALDRGSEDVLARMGGVLAANPDLRVRVEGNCDERGTEEYNLLLGQRRAEAARSYLVRMGATPAQVTASSNGKERPRAAGHDEAAWRQNRRDDLIPELPAKPVAAGP